MNYRQKCKAIGKWAFINYKGDTAIFASCQNCGYTYSCYTEEQRNEPSDGTPNKYWTRCVAGKPHRFCPSCGLKMSLFNGEKYIKLTNIRGNRISVYDRKG